MMRLDFREAFGICKTCITGVLLYPLIKFLQCQEDDPSFLEALLYFLGLEERVYKCRSGNEVWKPLILLIIIELVWIVLILTEPSRPLRKIKSEAFKFNKEEESAINDFVTEAVQSAQQSLIG
ncbi:uncharacterized protein LOC128193279 [Crassostrea angulata]|uniref:uncharacterized protein LOC128193279 n=1 Tax=Magallana angulata TaxID=2784310 RepID=UPI0022B14D17|nr:uncharacterized protein LOC128193279 [Crassostrea angulata]